MNDVSDEELVTQWLNNAAVARSSSEKLEYFHKLKEVLLRKSPHLLQKFLPNILNFTTDKNGDIKRALVGFIEELCKLRESLLPKVMLNLHMLLCDESIAVQKRVIQALIGLIKHPAAYEFVEKLTPLLIDLGYSQQDIIKIVPKAEERRKYCKRTLSLESLQIYNKRPRLDPQIEFDNDTNDNLRTHVDLALAWLFEEYGILQGFSRVPPLRKDTKLDKSYNTLLCTFINASSNDSAVFSRLLLEAPLITDEALDKVHQLCREEKKCTWALGLLRDLAVRKPPKQLMFLNALLSYTTYECNVIRDCAISHVLELHQRADLKLVIEEFARMNLEFLKLQRPPESLCGFSQGRLKSETWGDDFIKACLLPYISLLPANETLIHDLAKVYVQTGANIKRIILRLLETPIRSMGMDSPELLKLVEDCPKGSETLVTRVIHVLTDKGPPSAQLVQRVRDLYHTRVSDVIAALPKLIKLNPVVVREVFNRLLGLHGDSPITPTELLVALHLIDSNRADLKTIIKATSMCLQEKQVFTQEVLAVVLQQLMDQTPLPTLLMRTVIQALGSYPRLSGFVMNILQRLILKQFVYVTIFHRFGNKKSYGKVL
ncbi:hypothetical protein GEV33_001835 [Tenebrio molitor]|uniref:Symplekin C-terminal domain-containing protein n=1 Tax=Tenebrio molitor TaxID=7067 RepID=A0A8J6LPU7_TENMO|nr:hypothetical protein GEV33_001835 [Tenebrio molitor]